MPRPLWLRAVIALWGLWFTTALSEPAAFDTCPMHGGGMAQHTMGAGHASHTQPAGHQHGSSQNCTCLGTCCCVPPVAAPAAGFELPAARERIIAAALFPQALGEASARAYALPFANGPPASLRASL